MTETEFLQHVELVLSHIESALEASGADLDFERKGDTVLEIECADDSRIIVNSQAATREIWLAAKSGGQHFRFDGNNWVNTRSGAGFYEALSAVVSQQCGQAIVLRA